MQVFRKNKAHPVCSVFFSKLKPTYHQNFSLIKRGSNKGAEDKVVETKANLFQGSTVYCERNTCTYPFFLLAADKATDI